MAGSFEDDPAIDSLDYNDFEEMRRGTPPPWSGFPAWGPREDERVREAFRTLADRAFRVKVVVEDADTGQELWFVRPDIRARMGQIVKIELPLMLEAGP